MTTPVTDLNTSSHARWIEALTSWVRGAFGRPSRRRIGIAVAPFVLTAAGAGVYVAANRIGAIHAPSGMFHGAVIALLGWLATIVALLFAPKVHAANARGSSSRHRQNEGDWIGFEGAIEQASDAIVITDVAARIRYVNAAFTKLTGYCATEVVGQNPRLVQSGRQDRLFYKEMWDTILAGTTWHGELVNRRKDGTLYVEEMTIRPVRDQHGKVTQFVAIKSDVTANRGAQDAQAALVSIVESSEDAIFSTAPDGRIVSWNRGAEALYGYTSQEILGQPLSIFVPTEDHEPMRCRRDLLLQGERIPAFDGVSIRKDGTHVDVSVRPFPIRNGAGHVVGEGAIVRDISARKQSEKVQGMLASIVESSSFGVFTNAPDGTFLSWNKGAEAIWGYRPEEVLGKSIYLLGKPDQHRQQSQVLARGQQGEISEFEAATVRAGGEMIDTAMTVSPVRNAAGEVIAVSTIALDISARKRAEQALRQSEEKYRSLILNIPDVVWTTDCDGEPVFVSPGCERLCGYTPEEICRAGTWFAMIHPDDRPAHRAARAGLRASADVQSGGCSGYDLEFRIRNKQGQWIWVHSRATGAYEKCGAVYVDGVISDVSERKELEERLRYQLTHDTLTGLPNLRGFEDHFQRTVEVARRQNGRLALLYLELDGFQLINNTVGHQGGDNVLLQAAQRLSGCLRESEMLARCAGDDFMLILTEKEDRQIAPGIAERMLAALSAPFQAGGNEIFLSASIGIAFYPQDGQDLLSLQRSADQAMFDAKRTGKNRFQAFTAIMGAAAGRRAAVETELHHALERGELSLEYQPILRLETGVVAGAEVLLRWFSPKLGAVCPAEFIPIAEETGLILPVSRWVLAEACRQARSWRDAGLGKLQIAVNVSALQLADGCFPDTVARALAEAGLEASSLDLEVTESALMRNIDEAARQLADLKQLGVNISLDDFGTGYSSLSYLSRLPIDTVKVDQSFVRQMNGTESSATLVRAIVSLAHGLGMKVIAEGIESKRDWESLKAVKCDLGQGFLLGRPGPARLIAQALAMRSRHCMPGFEATVLASPGTGSGRDCASEHAAEIAPLVN